MCVWMWVCVKWTVHHCAAGWEHHTSGNGGWVDCEREEVEVCTLSKPLVTLPARHKQNKPKTNMYSEQFLQSNIYPIRVSYWMHHSHSHSPSWLELCLGTSCQEKMELQYKSCSQLTHSCAITAPTIISAYKKPPKAAGNPVFTVEASDVNRLLESNSTPTSYRQSTTDHITLSGNNIFHNTEGLSTMTYSYLFQQLVQLQLILNIK